MAALLRRNLLLQPSAALTLRARRASTAPRYLSSVAEPAVTQEQKTDGEKLIIAKLEAQFQPTRLDVEDVSGGCGTFYAITIASPVFKDLPRVKQHRLVTEVLKQEISSIHGLQLKTLPE